ncbi:cation:proton antiporter domain-containing protein [Haladaptatus caseinilyticus]|uniref:cation:proton antiporter domain-containing protein n=1 Tax=Haladaptatus caseinilyticus TaxID=2993314 RepID=UPI00224A8C44|nr:cation:proton antiporter [Haladaptatus caseinilyticus]
MILETSGGVLPPLSEHQLLFLLAQLFLLLLTARLLGEAAKYAGLPSVLGELLAGIVLGPSLLGTVAPGLFTMLFPQSAMQYHLLEVVSWLGLIMLLFITGFETDLDLIASRAKTATYTAGASILVPFVMGFGVAYLLPAQFLVASDQRLVFSLFIATALSISAIPVIAKVLIDMELIDRDIGQITIASGMINDTVGWILLAVVAGLARSGSGEALDTAGQTILLLFLFLGGAFLLGGRFVGGIFRWVDNTIGGDVALTTTAMILALGVGSITQYLGLEAVLGAFIVGIFVGRVKRFDQAAQHSFEVITLGVFAPIFFATAGLRVDLAALLAPPTLLAAGVVLAVAIAGKFAGSFVGAKAAGLSNWEGIALGSGLNARGALEIIVATIGISVGVLTGTMYTIIVVVAIVTSLIAPPLLRVSLARVEMSESEAERLAQKEREEQSFLGNVVRVLLPTRCSVDSLFAARLVGHVARNREMEVTCTYVTRGEERATSGGSLARRIKRVFSRSPSIVRPTEPDGGVVQPADDASDRAETCLDSMTERLSLPPKQVRSTVRNTNGNVSETVLDEAGQGYDMLVLGAGRYLRAADGSLFSAEIDDVLQESPCPVMAVSAGEANPERAYRDDSVRRILLPTIGNEYSRQAAEIAFAIANECDASVEILHVVNRLQVEEPFVGEADLSEAIEFGEDIVEREAELGRQMGATVRKRVSIGDRPERSVVERAMLERTDLVVLGTKTRPLSRRVFFGHRVEHILRNAPCAVAVVSSP